MVHLLKGTQSESKGHGSIGSIITTGSLVGHKSKQRKAKSTFRVAVGINGAIRK